MTAGGSAAFVGTPAEVALIRFGLFTIEFYSSTHENSFLNQGSPPCQFSNELFLCQDD